MARAAGAAAAAEHLPTLTRVLGQLCRPDIDSSSPLLVPLLAAVEPLAACLGPAVAPVLPPVLPLLAQWATRDVGLEVSHEGCEVVRCAWRGGALLSPCSSPAPAVPAMFP